MIEIEYNYASVRMCKPRSLYTVHVADYKVWSGYYGQFMYMWVVVHCAQHRCISTTGAFIQLSCYSWLANVKDTELPPPLFIQGAWDKAMGQLCNRYTL